MSEQSAEFVKKEISDYKIATIGLPMKNDNNIGRNKLCFVKSVGMNWVKTPFSA